jgi:predicted RNA-binding Zn-ribbon protein involved in translation (DUF1610 family)
MRRCGLVCLWRSRPTRPHASRFQCRVGFAHRKLTSHAAMGGRVVCAATRIWSHYFSFARQKAPRTFPRPSPEGPASVSTKNAATMRRCGLVCLWRSRPARPHASRFQCTAGSAHPTDSLGSALERKPRTLRISIRRRREYMAGGNCIRGFSVLGWFRAAFTRGRSAWRVRTSPPVTRPVRRGAHEPLCRR